MLNWSVLLSWAVAIALAAILVSNYMRLSSIPGPFWASFTNLWRAYETEYGAEFRKTLEGLHKKYGPFVRIGPTTVSISDPSAIPTIYSMHGEFKKADSYQGLRALSNGKVMGSVIDIQDEDEVSALKRAVGSAFATKNLLNYESDVDYTADTLVQAIRKRGTVDVLNTMQQFQVDFLMKVAFSKETDYLRAEKSTQPISVEPRLRHWSRWQPIPLMERILFKSPLCPAWYRGVSKPPVWTAMAIEEFQRHQQPNLKEKFNLQPDLLTKYIQGGERNKENVRPEVLIRMISSTISAGFDTSAFTMTTILYFLLRNPDSLQKLKNEMDSAMAAGHLSNPPRYTEADKLKYLSAVIKETMRLYQFFTILLEREVPAGGAEIAGQWFPGGTVVGVPADIVHRDVSVFGKDARRFRPDRWLEADEPRRLQMEKTVLGFGAGKRVCLGRHIAELEMKKVIPRLLLEFNVSLQIGVSF
ncbi:uncharacterized protein Z518_08704 [Rhinocladiella mackenziei CBS 650.93]|uniref:Rhinocladiella mackenziei CBS 650.93 unplaced genomic scaffold supercont1.6, whole genome shotgun sequence n=1 Tax=Rhinocladiella mackenziei CBS 650.93 TaxID=1442369 RepID=A0A0D2FLB2_9EURO|nr:uncharacterized protein Z518_08704 [Rhinocladiella mackenziei CBS 650.93]KIX02762.1 hypothetical protein Z518_08704 [Rhinocladiella mackenziei CBS 650.93]